ncbi:MAG: IPT/TIG domain-containing protein [Acidobacteriota bacterium]
MSIRPFILLGVFAAWPAGCEEAAEEYTHIPAVAEGWGVSAATYFPAPSAVAPLIRSLSPNRGLTGTSINVTIEGSGLNDDPEVQVAGTGVSATIQSSSLRKISVTLSIDPYATPGNHAVTVVSGGRTTNSRDFYVQIPTALAVVSVKTLPTGSSGQFGCTPAMNYGIKVKVTYQVIDQDGNPIASSDMQPQEEVVDQDINGVGSSPVPDWSDIGPSRISGTSRFTNSKGQYMDAPLGICGDAPFHEQADLEVSVLVNGRRYQVRAQNLRISSSAKGQGSISNSLDISRSRP